MSWVYFYNLLKKNKGDISKANPAELRKAALANLNQGPTSALNHARKIYFSDPQGGQGRTA